MTRVMVGYSVYYLLTNYQGSDMGTKNILISSIMALFISITAFGIKIPATPTIDTPPKQTQQPMIIPPPPNVNARGYVLMDVSSGKIIAEKNMDKKMPPASLTKLMTLYVTSTAIANGQAHLSDMVRISKTAWKRGGSRMFLKLGSRVPLKDLIEGIIVASGNDACVATAQYIAGNETSFAALMNLNAQKLGMSNTHYVDSTGLPKPGHYSSPHDIAKLARAIIRDFPQDYAWYKQKWIKYNGIRQPNRNRLLWRDPSADGLKTGHTKAAGYCLVASAKRNDTRLLSVVMGTPTDSARANDSEALLNWGFRFYKSYKLFSKATPITSARVWLGKNKQIPLGLNQDMYVTIPIGSYPQLKANMELKQDIQAPIEKGQPYGDVVISLNGKTISTVPLLALEDDPTGGMWSKFTDRIAMLFHHWVS